MALKENSKLKICRRQSEMAGSIEYQTVTLQSDVYDHKKNQSEAINKNCTRRRGEEKTGDQSERCKMKAPMQEDDGLRSKHPKNQDKNQFRKRLSASGKDDRTKKTKKATIRRS